MPSDNGESQPLLPGAAAKISRSATPKRVVGGLLSLLFVVTTVAFAVLYINEREAIRRDPLRFSLDLLDHYPLIDTHIDLPEWVRFTFRNNASAVDLYNLPKDGKYAPHVDIPMLREGRVGGFFWSVYTDCPKNSGVLDEFLIPTNSVRDTLEQIDITKALVAKHSEIFHLAKSAKDIRDAIKAGKIASIMGIEGGHQFGNSIAAARQFFDLGVRYATLTHSCHNAFADSAGIAVTPIPYHGGLSPLGKKLVYEMNRIGMIVDISHVSQDTARQVLKISKAPVIFSHSSAMGVWEHPRNVPDDILRMIGTGPNKTDAVVQVNFAPQFVGADGNATVSVVADHVEWIARVAGKAHVGLGSDFDGITTVPVGLENVSKYPNLFAELRHRGWSASDLRGLAGANFLRVFEGVEATARKLKDAPRVEDLYYLRTDL